MKKSLNLFLSVIAIVITLIGCNNDRSNYLLYSTPYDYAKFKQEDILHVDVKDGELGIVTFYGDTIAVLDESSDIMIPYVGDDLVEGNKMSSRAEISNPIVVSHVDAASGLTYSTWFDMIEAIAFEDSQDGDYDYNDLVLNVRIGKTKGTSKGGISFQPVALGSRKVIGLGACVTTSDSNQYKLIFSNNIRKDLFKDMAGFINTEKETGVGLKTWYKFELPNNKDILKISWFIIDGSNELYAVSDDFYSKSVDKKGRPYGLVFTNIHGAYDQISANGSVRGTYGSHIFYYPRERVNINKVYPDFDKLFNSDSKIKFNEVFGNPDKNKCVHVMQITKDDNGKERYYNADERNLYFIRPDGGNILYDDGGTLELVSIEKI